MRNTYRVRADISLDALEYNIRQIKAKIRPETKLMCVIKANAYGHGAAVLAQELLAMGADSFAVATADEGVELRRNGIEVPILILGYVNKEEYPMVISYDLTPTVSSYTTAKDLDKAADKLGKVVNIDIKIDTGMSRIGFKVSEESVKSIKMIDSLLHNVKIHGIFTHFSCADCEDDQLTKKQAEKFITMIDHLKKCGVDIPCRHCANSAAIMRYPEFQMDMVRAGIIIYGLYPSEEVDKSLLPLKPVMSLKSRIVHIKKVEAGTPVGYGATFVCKRPTRIATVSIGYADGYPRTMSNRGRVLIDNNSYPIIGRVCMDQLMVDITDAVTEINQGDEVTLIGGQGSEAVSAEEVAAPGGSFNYELVCNVNRRVPRVYLRNGHAVREVNYLDQITKSQI